MKRKSKIVLITLAIAGCIFASSATCVQQEDVATERDKAAYDRKAYTAKKYECSGTANTTNSYVNNAGLTDCGGEMAVSSNLTMESLYDIYHNYCNKGFGIAVYGCTIPAIRKIYVCAPGTTLYDRQNTYAIRYACNDVDIGNTIRHELLHLVYLDLSTAEQEQVSSKLSKYKTEYASQLLVYSESQRDDELFVRVGADGRQVDDIEIVDLYSKVSSVYVAQKQEYYGRLLSAADEYYDKYDELYNKYSTQRAILIIIAIINAVVLIIVVVSKDSYRNEHIRQMAQTTIGLRQKSKLKLRGATKKASVQKASYFNTIAPAVIILGILGFFVCYMTFGAVGALLELLAVISDLVLLVIADKILSSRNARKYKEQQEMVTRQKREEEQKRQEAQNVKEEEERKRRENLEIIKTYLYVQCHIRVKDVLNDENAADWITENIIGNIIDDLGYKSLLKAKDSVTSSAFIALGPYTLNWAQIFSWKGQYSHFLRKKAAEESRPKNPNSAKGEV